MNPDLESSVYALIELAKDLSDHECFDFAFRLYHETYLLEKNNPTEVRLSYRLISLLGMSETAAKQGERTLFMPGDGRYQPDERSTGQYHNCLSAHA